MTDGEALVAQGKRPLDRNVRPRLLAFWEPLHETFAIHFLGLPIFLFFGRSSFVELKSEPIE